MGLFCKSKDIRHPATRIVGQGISRINTKREKQIDYSREGAKNAKERKKKFCHRFSQINTDIKVEKQDARLKFFEDMTIIGKKVYMNQKNVAEAKSLQTGMVWGVEKSSGNPKVKHRKIL